MRNSNRVIVGIIAISFVFTACFLVSVFATDRIGGKGAKVMDAGCSISLKPVAQSLGETPVGEQAESQDQVEQALPPGIARMEEVPGEGLHKGWEQGNHNGWDKQAEAETPEAEVPAEAEASEADTPEAEAPKVGAPEVEASEGNPGTDLSTDRFINAGDTLPSNIPPVEPPEPKIQVPVILVSSFDFNSDGKFDESDANTILGKIANNYSFSKADIRKFDLNGDGKVTSTDALLLKQIVNFNSLSEENKAGLLKTLKTNFASIVKAAFNQNASVVVSNRD